MTTVQSEFDIAPIELSLRPPAVRHVLDGLDGGVARDYLLFLADQASKDSRSPGDLCTCKLIELTPEKSGESPLSGTFCSADAPSEIVLFAGQDISPRLLRAITWMTTEAQTRPMKCLVVIRGLSRHFEKSGLSEIETLLHKHLKPHLTRLVIVRTGFILSPLSATNRWAQRLSGFHQLFLPRMTSTFIDGSTLFSVVNEELEKEQRSWDCSIPLAGIGLRELTIPGQRRSWRSVFEQLQSNGLRQKIFRIPAAGLSLIGIPWLLFWIVVLSGKLLPALRQFHFHTLKPRSVRELISLCNRHSCDDIQIAGYNNGVNHFGWKYPHKTLVLTTSLPGRVRLKARPPDDFAAGDSTVDERVTVDAGLTLHHCIKQLNKAAREFCVLPNYSWISMGTLFFVPVHGSGSRVSTLGDTIEEVLLYDGDHEQFVKARRGEAVFRETMYNRNRHWLLLRLTLRVREKSTCFVRRSSIDNPSSEDIQQLFLDPEVSHVEIRKNKAASSAIDVNRYYIDTSAGGNDSMEMPRDSIGRIWDRLEETPIVSTLFHWFVRTFAFHVELFLKPDEFAIFWKHHQSLPISKIQLRRVLKDGMSHSACEHCDCISADLFMTRRNRDVFCQFIATHLPAVRTNPGKQSI